MMVLLWTVYKKKYVKILGNLQTNLIKFNAIICRYEKWMEEVGNGFFLKKSNFVNNIWRNERSDHDSKMFSKFVNIQCKINFMKMIVVFLLFN